MPIKVLMVCLGNICRSPLAEGILQSKVNPALVKVDSAGTSGYHHGELPDSRSIATGLSHNIDIRQQRSRKFSIRDFDTFDKIFVMDKSNYNNVIALARNDQDKNKVMLILNQSHPNKNLEVPDPYYDDNGFEAVYQMLDQACNQIAKTLPK
ncbi:MAG: low molecular weight phosphotyrosine protein phosphatase [Flavobacteriaceae bacterium]|nr:low molecular weight phosphotyrosine protein phosphatase [Flavobacteriaceae bacterium]